MFIDLLQQLERMHLKCSLNPMRHLPSSITEHYNIKRFVHTLQYVRHMLFYYAGVHLQKQYSVEYLQAVFSRIAS